VNQAAQRPQPQGCTLLSEMLALLQETGVRIANVTLHVGLDTFRPVQVEDLGEHQMHGELCEISEQSADLIISLQGE